jgi:hypothetical protein
VNTLNTIPAWVWFAPLTIYIVYVIRRTIYVYRKELNEYNLSRQNSRKRNQSKITKNTSQTINGGNVLAGEIKAPVKQNTTNSHNIYNAPTYITFNVDNAKEETSLLPPAIITIIRKKDELAYQIIDDLQEFRDRFNEVRPGSFDEQRKGYISTHEVMAKIFKNDFRDAEKLFTNQITDKILEINKKLNIFGSLLMYLKPEVNMLQQDRLMASIKLWGREAEDEEALTGQVNSLIK